MVVVAIDAGTTGVRCMLVGGEGKVLAIGRRSWKYETPPDLEIAKEFDADAFWDLACAAIKDALHNSKTLPSDLEAVATTSQRHGVVFLDNDGVAVYAGPNIDARGAMTQYVIEDEIGTAYQEITGCWPPLMFSPTRLAWFEEEDPEAFSRIRHVLPISDWLTFRLCSELVSEPSAASGTGLLDIRKRAWSPEIAGLAGIDVGMLPPLVEAGTIVGQVTVETSIETGLPSGLDVVQGGSDTSCALLAAQSSEEEITVIAGSTTPVMLVVDRPICSADQAIWTGCHIENGKWVLESNATLTGACLEWAIRLLCERSEDPDACAALLYDDLPRIIQSVPPGSNDTYVALGPSVMDCKQMTRIPQARMFFPQPALPQVIPLSSGALVRGVLENIGYAVRENIEQLEQYGQGKCVKSIGGMTKSDAWAVLLSNIMSRPVAVPVESEGSMLGAAMCASVGAGIHPTLDKAMQEMVYWKETYQPDETTDAYKSHYKKWQKIWYEGDYDA